MSESVGFFQVEEVLITKINSSPIKDYIELYAGTGAPADTSDRAGAPAAGRRKAEAADQGLAGMKRYL